MDICLIYVDIQVASLSTRVKKSCTIIIGNKLFLKLQCCGDRAASFMVAPEPIFSSVGTENLRVGYSRKSLFLYF